MEIPEFNPRDIEEVKNAYIWATNCLIERYKSNSLLKWGDCGNVSACSLCQISTKIYAQVELEEKSSYALCYFCIMRKNVKKVKFSKPCQCPNILPNSFKILCSPNLTNLRSRKVYGISKKAARCRLKLYRYIKASLIVFDVKPQSTRIPYFNWKKEISKCSKIGDVSNK